MEYIDQEEQGISVEYDNKKTVIEINQYGSGTVIGSIKIKLSADETRKLIKALELCLGQHMVECLVL